MRLFFTTNNNTDQHTESRAGEPSSVGGRGDHDMANSASEQAPAGSRNPASSVTQGASTANQSEPQSGPNLPQGNGNTDTTRQGLPFFFVNYSFNIPSTVPGNVEDRMRANTDLGGVGGDTGANGANPNPNPNPNADTNNNAGGRNAQIPFQNFTIRFVPGGGGPFGQTEPTPMPQTAGTTTADNAPGNPPGPQQGRTQDGSSWYRMGNDTFFFQAPNDFFRFAGFAGEREKPRASDRAIARLKQVDVNSLPESERSCPICYDAYTSTEPVPQKADATDINIDADADPEVSDIDSHMRDVNTDASVPSSMHTQDDDPEVSAPDHYDDPEESVPDADAHNIDSDPPTSVPENPTEPAEHAAVAMPCHHIFGYACIKEWLKTNNTCPLCRTTIESQEDYLRSTGEQRERPHQPFGSNPLADFLFNTLPQMMNQPNFAQTHGQTQGQTTETPTEGQNESPQPEQGRQQSPNTGNNIFGFPFLPGLRLEVQSVDTFVPGVNGWVREPRPQGSPQPSATPGTSANPSANSPTTTPESTQTPPPASASTSTPASARQSNTAPSATTSSSSSGGSRYHPYRPQPSTTASSSSSASSFTSRNRDGAALRTDLQCSSIPLGICVGPASGAEDPEEPDSTRDPNQLLRLSCGHGFHLPCLRMCMRAHGDSHIPNLTDEDDGGSREVWCVRCRRYCTVSV